MTSAFEKRCPSCTTPHKITGRFPTPKASRKDTLVPPRDSDFLSCIACGEELYRWHGDLVFHATLAGGTDEPAETKTSRVVQLFIACSLMEHTHVHTCLPEVVNGRKVHRCPRCGYIRPEIRGFPDTPTIVFTPVETA